MRYNRTYWIEAQSKYKQELISLISCPGIKARMAALFDIFRNVYRQAADPDLGMIEFYFLTQECARYDIFYANEILKLAVIYLVELQALQVSDHADPLKSYKTCKNPQKIWFNQGHMTFYMRDVVSRLPVFSEPKDVSKCAYKIQFNQGYQRVLISAWDFDVLSPELEKALRMINIRYNYHTFYEQSQQAIETSRKARVCKMTTVIIDNVPHCDNNDAMNVESNENSLLRLTDEESEELMRRLHF
ncbi:MAG: hypothetical protein HWD59_07600 [Coxiellaceae bacterium]|nr:MAG: hypothetical protein HWD59_07600 [Coxiellaceae bacterium]